MPGPDDATADDALLMARVQEGGRGAFAELVRRHHLRFYRVAYRYLSDKEEAEDALQTAFLKLWERPDAWKADGNARFTTWFYRVVANVCLDAAKRRKPLSVPEDFDPEDPGERQDEAAPARERGLALEREIAALPERQRMALDLCFYEGASNAEAAALMGIGVKALESLAMRAKARLRERLKAFMADEDDDG